MNNKKQDILVVGLALFAMFFGAGNLIFPPSLGQQAGNQVFLAIAGFLLTGVGLPLFGIIAVAKFGGDLELLGTKVSKNFGVALTVVVTLAIGPFLAIPRTSATTFEMAILPFFSNMNGIIFSIVYFAIVLFFVLRPSSLIDNIGKILTPLLFITLLGIIIKGIITPMGEIIPGQIRTPFSGGFIEGYQTMDVLGATVFGSIVVGAIRAKGYKDAKQITGLTAKAGMIAALGLGIIYGGLAYLGATASTFAPDLTRTQLIMAITENIFGVFGKVLLGIAVGLACLTTSIGLTAATGEYFSKLSNGKVSYRMVCILTAAFSIVISNAGVEQIADLSSPLLEIIYPVVIVLILLTLFDKYIKHGAVYRAMVYTTLTISILEVLGGFNIHIPGVKQLLALLPLADQGFSWIVPTMVVGAAIMIFYKGAELTDNHISVEE